MSSTDENHLSDQTRDTTLLERQIKRADQRTVINTNAVGHQIDRAAGWIARKVNVGSNVLARYRQIENTAESNSLTLTTPIEHGSKTLITSADIPQSKIMTNEYSKKSGELTPVNNSVGSNVVQPTIDTQKSGTGSIVPLDKSTKMQRITARENKPGLIDGFSIQRKLHNAMEGPTLRTASIDRLLSRSSVNETPDTANVSTFFSAGQPQGSSQIFRSPTSGQSKVSQPAVTNFGNINALGETARSAESISIDASVQRQYRSPGSAEPSVDITRSHPLPNVAKVMDTPETNAIGKSEGLLLLRSADNSKTADGIVSHEYSVAPSSPTRMRATAKSNTAVMNFINRADCIYRSGNNTESKHSLNSSKPAEGIINSGHSTASSEQSSRHVAAKDNPAGGRGDCNYHSFNNTEPKMSLNSSNEANAAEPAKTNTATIPVAPVMETTHSAPAEFIWRKSDSMAQTQAATNAHLQLGGARNTQTVLRSPDGSGTSDTPATQSGVAAPGNVNTTVKSAAVDVEAIGEQLERLLTRRMLVERERRGENL